MSKADLGLLFRDITQLGLPKSASPFSLVSDSTAMAYDPDRYKFYLNFLDFISDPEQKNAKNVFTVIARNRREHESIQENIDRIARSINLLRSTYTRPDFVGGADGVSELERNAEGTHRLVEDLNAQLLAMPGVNDRMEFVKKAKEVGMDVGETRTVGDAPAAPSPEEQAERAAREQELEALRKKQEELTKTVAEKLAEIEALNKRVAETEADVAEKQKALEEANNELARVRNELAAVQQDEAKAQQDIYDFEQKLKELNSYVVKLEQYIEQYEQAIENKQKHINNLQQQLEGSYRVNAEIQSQLQEAVRTKTGLEEQLRQSKEQLRKTQEQAARTVRALEAANKAREAAEARVAAAERAAAEAEAVSVAAEAAKVAAEKERDQAREKAATAEAEKAAVEARAREAEAAEERAKAERARAAAEAERARAEAAEERARAEAAEERARAAKKPQTPFVMYQLQQHPKLLGSTLKENLERVGEDIETAEYSKYNKEIKTLTDVIILNIDAQQNELRYIEDPESAGYKEKQKKFDTMNITITEILKDIEEYKKLQNEVFKENKEKDTLRKLIDLAIDNDITKPKTILASYVNEKIIKELYDIEKFKKKRALHPYVRPGTPITPVKGGAPFPGSPMEVVRQIGGSYFSERLDKLNDIMKQKDKIPMRDREGMEDDVVLEYENNALYNPDLDKVTFTDKLVFIGMTFALRAITLVLLNSAIHSQYVKTFTQAFSYYFGIYTLLFLIWVMIVNLRKEDYIPGLLFYYVNANYDVRVWMRVGIHIVIQALVLPLPILLTPRFAKTAETDTFEKRESMYNTLTFFTFVIWIITSLAALKA